MRFNLKKSVINQDEEEKQPQIVKNKVALVWGSQNSGKSLISTMLAKELAKKYKDKNVALLYTEENLPILPCFFPESKLGNIQSLGSLYTPVKISTNYLIENLTTLKNIENLALLGFQKSEHFAMYPPLSDDLISQLFTKLKETFDFVIIDSSTFFHSNQLAFQSFEVADINLKIMEENLKSSSYFSSSENFLNSVGVKQSKTLTIVNKVTQNDTLEFSIPFSKEVFENCEKTGDILKISDSKFLEKIEELIKGVF